MDMLVPGAFAPQREQTATLAGLVYSDDDRPGLRRVRRGRGFGYFDARGRAIGRPALERVRKLAIPPAWTDVWISPSARGHIQATGRDARGRKQYIYHEDWRAHRDLFKYEQVLQFAHALPKLRATVADHLALRRLERQRVLAVVVALLEQTLIRIGNQSYARENESYGLTTLTSDHVEIAGSELRFDFKGKSGRNWKLAIRDRRIANVVRKCQDLPGQLLFGYIDDDGVARTIDSGDVNAYLQETAGASFTAKTFRTWAGTVLAARALASEPRPAAPAARKRAAATAVKWVAARLGNTPAVCRSSYIHPEIFSAFEEGALHELFGPDCRLIDGPTAWMADEEIVIALLKKRTAARKLSKGG